ncbi:methyltransferase domain-containing protein [Pedobacter jejuensis]|uniref:Methyltransferase domain-containing protein n=1 Tax=Pedobacter jejuensis TaxID=1268550 RepID=A0A3N0BPB8_9SPHI|nr:methyltransferase domain-containing protein [Pedobacter jejuensis]RNL50188.1 methyltransferase domain-containing protein [Pedobacter jejuensis]
MEQIRKPFQGVLNIVRFNWHFYAIAIILILGMLYIANFFERPYIHFIYIFCSLSFASICSSLLASLYIYDCSGFYLLKWIDKNNQEKIIVNINAGFDETSYLLQEKYKNAKLIALDFYNPLKHTEVSIKRARKAYPPFPNTMHTKTSSIALETNSVDKIFVILAAHEIRDEIERTNFFLELNRIIKPEGQIYVTEHLRDFKNFLAFNIGAFHFHSKSAWLQNFNNANLNIKKEIKLTPFISTFTLDKDGNSL